MKKIRVFQMASYHELERQLNELAESCHVSVEGVTSIYVQDRVVVTVVVACEPNDPVHELLDESGGSVPV